MKKEKAKPKEVRDKKSENGLKDLGKWKVWLKNLIVKAVNLRIPACNYITVSD